MPKKQARGFGAKFRSLDSFVIRHSDFVIQSLKSSSVFEEKLEAGQATCDTKSRR
jgi:hypothetical protein